MRLSAHGNLGLEIDESKAGRPVSQLFDGLFVPMITGLQAGPARICWNHFSR